jgi:hypothetical protein
MVKRKKKNNFTVDLGAQTLIRDDKSNTFVRKVDGERLRLVAYGQDRHLEKEHKSVLENYFARDLLDIHNKENNSKRFWAGRRYEDKFESSNIRQRITASLKENLGNSTKEEFIIQNFDAQSDFRFIDKELGKLSKILWVVIIENKPARKRMDELREALDRLIILFDM